jgi:hypothetical protein
MENALGTGSKFQSDKYDTSDEFPDIVPLVYRAVPSSILVFLDDNNFSLPK